MKAILLGVSIALSVITIPFICVCLAGLSFNQDTINNVYWAEAKTGNPELVSYSYDFDVEYRTRFGLRMYVEKCDGDLCEKEVVTDDLPLTVSNSDEEKSIRFESCEVDDDSFEDICYDCRNSGRATGGMCIIAFFLILAAIGLNGVRFTDNDSTAIKFVGIGVHSAILIFSLMALAVWGGQCYQSLRDNYLDSEVVLEYNGIPYDEYKAEFDTDHIKWAWGPAPILLCFVLGFQPVIMLLLILTPTGTEEGGDSGGGRNKEPVPVTEEGAADKL